MARGNLLRGLKHPKEVYFEAEEERENYGRFIAYPFEHGYGSTIGNSLRRILLSSIQGYAISAIQVTHHDVEGVVKTVSSEFDVIPGMVEDTLTFISNLKKLNISLLNSEEEEARTILIKIQGEGELTGADFETEEGIRVHNKDHHLATFMPDTSLEIEAQIGFGRGYRSAEENQPFIEIIGTIVLDCNFSPVDWVRFRVEPTRVGQRSDYDKLILEVETNGTLMPADAVAEAAKLAKEQYSVFINFDESLIVAEEEVSEDELKVKKLLEKTVDELELSVRSSNCLRSAQIRTVGELVSWTEDDIAKTRNFGKKSLQEIKDKLASWGLNFGMTDFHAILKSVKLNEIQ
ncbi:DNA-directed RNA polymerase subunit alpha [Candidatus Haliotispira prima]|uniref:DNA-directed RNA polymerase subunit alpha n=1 Tax=Candidatus Haliotispira prima TaxID=3034016 RepID=A0ABY8MFY0_9SPIO|nr:DNA-directed RNA polymerase subunit alpha [Candidatus Haliotispira prima]